jgi:hypothetical protein
LIFTDIEVIPIDIFTSILGKKFPIIQKIFEDNKIIIMEVVDQLKRKGLVLYENQQIDKDLDILMILNEMHQFKAVLTHVNGNCLYNAISIQLFAYDENFYLNKLGVLEIILKHEMSFRIMLSKTVSSYSYEGLIENIAIRESWGNEYCKVAISILCDRPLYVYSIGATHTIPYSYEYCMSDIISKKKRLGIKFKIYHFSAILAVNEDDLPLKPIMNQFINRFDKLFEI